MFFEAVFDQHGGVIHVPQVIKRRMGMLKKGTVSSLCTGNPGGFHNAAGDKEDCIFEAEIYIDPGYETHRKKRPVIE